MADPAFVIIIPARYESTRFPGKPLALLKGATGIAKPLIQRSWEAATAITGCAGVYVATDDGRIADAVNAFGGQVVLTDPTCRNGTERCAEAASELGLTDEIVVNLQGDAPLTPAFIVTELVAALMKDRDTVMATPAVRCSPTLLAHLVQDQAQGRVGGTTVVANRIGHALYFSKRVIPHVPESKIADAHDAVHLHLGVYAYRVPALRAYAAMAPSLLEELEGLEQLRFLEGAGPIRAVPFAPLEWDCIELNNPEDTSAIEAVLRARGIV